MLFLVCFTFHRTAETHRHLEHLQSLNTQTQVHNVLLRTTLMRNMLKLLFEEFMWMIKVYTNTFIKKKKQYLAAISFEKDGSNNSAIYIYLCDNSRMKLTSKWQIAESFYDCWFMFAKTVWPSSYAQRLTQIYETCAKALPPKDLPAHWQQGLSSDNFKTLWEGLFNARTSWPRYQMKKFWGQYQATCALTGLYFTHSCIIWFEPIQHKHDKKEIKIWNLTMSVLYILLLLANWPQIFGHWWKSNMFVDWEWLSAPDGFGPQSAFLAVFFIFGLHHCDKFQNLETFLKIILPSEYWGILSRLKQIKIPDCFNWEEITRSLWNPTRDDHHPSTKWSPLTFAVMTLMYYFHYDIVLAFYGAARFKRNAHFGSSLMSGKPKSASTSILHVFQSLKMDSITLTKAQRKSLQATFGRFASLTLDCMVNPKPVGLTKYSLQYIIDRMYYIYVVNLSVSTVRRKSQLSY